MQLSVESFYVSNNFDLDLFNLQFTQCRNSIVGLHQHKVALLVLLCYTNYSIFMVSKNTRHFSYAISNAI